MGRILVIEEEAELRDLLRDHLRQAGHGVNAASTAADGLRLARRSRDDLVVVDHALPDMAGTDVCRIVKHDPELRGVYVVVLIAERQDVDRVRAFELGADDCMVKPFSVRELVLRVQAILRRSTPDHEPAPLIEFGTLRVDRMARRVWVDQTEVDLTDLQFRLLLRFYERKNRVQSRGALLQDVWGTEAETEARSVDVVVKALRRRLGSAGDYIETVRGVGYRFAERPS